MRIPAIETGKPEPVVKASHAALEKHAIETEEPVVETEKPSV